MSRLFDLADGDAPTTSVRLVDLHDATAPALAALADAIAPFVLKRPTEPVTASTLAEARILLTAARQVVSREPGGRAPLELRGPLDWAGLATKLALARSALNRFYNRYRDFDTDTLTGYWRTPDIDEIISRAKGLHED